MSGGSSLNETDFSNDTDLSGIDPTPSLVQPPPHRRKTEHTHRNSPHPPCGTHSIVQQRLRNITQHHTIVGNQP